MSEAGYGSSGDSDDGRAARQVARAFETWDNTFDSGNAVALVKLYTPDAYVLTSTHQAVTGHDHLVQMFGSFFAAGYTNHLIDPFDIVDLGDTLIASSKWSATIQPKGGPATQTGGLCTHVLQKQPGGSLRVRVHIFN
jgi:uncharacterized protein (TIGR02246 family)